MDQGIVDAVTKSFRSHCMDTQGGQGAGGGAVQREAGGQEGDQHCAP